ncbi:hypothetical protein [Sphingomonas montanisoli]|uniref:hypothetical protein n=1 Tax=Sphingomonas montanisoli TaxID=2606412 RepID=UPI0015E15DC6|nr:hypothetical protein [Sphingomonas montanisoli]
MQAATIGRTIGTASVAFGFFDTLYAYMLGTSVGADAKIFQAAGLREIGTGIAGIANPASSKPVWARFAADLGDLATLGVVAAQPNTRRKGALIAIGIVAAVTAIDFFAARAIDRRTPSPDI